MFDQFHDLRDGEPYPPNQLEALTRLWDDPAIHVAYTRGSEAALPEKYVEP